ncbi:sulfotransferase domain-containing protein [Mariniblastus fucicola]|uniref:Sulfotransferase domain protein n=1 Tax=Mariniblastus fucicola TaxID=980251 RepID=A0A5B9PHV2_9BACT|nr:sulfotransferase domain-containing protein [Mariniblastus fucicola]QEG22213.1 Sulfotransferase domain protein [Mariniblastus fucicola]
MKNQNVLIVSHRRSGTHLTIDSIRNNFPRMMAQEYVVLETFDPAHQCFQSVPELRQLTANGERIIKTHFPFDAVPDLPTEEARYSTELFHDSKLIYVVRNGLDVMASLYEFRRGHKKEVEEMSFSQFIREPSYVKYAGSMDKVTYWANHVESWLNSPLKEKILVVQFEDWMQDYAQTLKKIGKHLDMKRDWFKTDVRLGKRQKKKAQIERTWVEPRKGKMGDYLNYFSQEDLDYFFDRCENVMTRLGYRVEDFATAAKF